MKEIALLFILLVIYSIGKAQTIEKIKDIDSLIFRNERSIETTFQKTERSKIVSSHRKNPDYFASIYKLSANQTLVSATYILYSTGDTTLILNYYFDSTQLVKAKLIDTELPNRRIEESFYYSNGQLINNDIEIKGPYPPEYYLKKSTELLKKLQKKPVRFSE